MREESYFNDFNFLWLHKLQHFMILKNQNDQELAMIDYYI